MQECLCHLKFAMHGSRRDLQRFRCLVIREAAETKQFYDFTLSLVVVRQPPQGEIQFDDTGGGLRSDHHCLVELNFFCAASPLLSLICFGMIHQDAPEHVGCDCKKMNTVLPLYVGVYEPEVSFIH